MRPEAVAVRDAAGQSEGEIFEGFHYLHHPVIARLHQVVESGEIGEVGQVDITLATPAPPDVDPRWAFELAGGASMDLGCYVLSAFRLGSRWTGVKPMLTAVQAERRAGRPGVDERMRVEVAYSAGTSGTGLWDMNAEARTMVWTVVGSHGSVTVPSFAVPHLDNRIVVETSAGQAVEHLGDQTSYFYQLEALATALRGEAAFPIDIDESVAILELVDACYQAAGLPTRPSRLRDQRSKR